MARAVLLKAKLYQEEGTPSEPSIPSLRGGRCTCGAVFFPMQNYGCEFCGRHDDAVQPVALSGKGKLLSSATVHLHTAKSANPAVRSLTAPFTVGVIRLEDGPTIRTLIVGARDKDLAPGTEMVATLEPVGTEDPSLVDLRFTPAR
jgi:uncharacterized OB-fold protein